MLLDQMRRWLDHPIPALQHKSPRQAVRSKRSRDAVTHLLDRQEQIFRRSPQTAGVDLLEIWQALDLTRPSPPPDSSVPPA